MELHFIHVKSTKTCEVFQYGSSPDSISLYLKKNMLDAAGISPTADLTVNIKEAEKHD